VGGKKEKRKKKKVVLKPRKHAGKKRGKHSFLRRGEKQEISSEGREKGNPQ